MSDQPTTRELYKAKAITDEEVRAAVDAYMADPATSLFAITERYSLDLAGAVRSHAWAQQTVSNADATEYLKRTAVCTAILLARPENR